MVTEGRKVVARRAIGVAVASWAVESMEAGMVTEEGEAAAERAVEGTVKAARATRWVVVPGMR